ncbi:MAG: cytochrome c oxidase subunit I, partial [Cyanobacteria bacterium J06635_10]
KFASINEICTYGSYILAISTIPFIINVIWSWRAGKKAGNNPWDSLTLEWMTTSPPAIENFEAHPFLLVEPYEYGTERAKQVVALSHTDKPFTNSKSPAPSSDPDGSSPAIATEAQG